MRKIIYTLLILIGTGTMSFAQESHEIANTNGKSELLKSKISGEYVFTLPSTVTAELVEKHANYYTSSFTVDYDEASHESKVTMVENEVGPRHVIVRFLGSFGVRFLEIDGENITIDEFVSLYLK